jgi:hypothetical protein
MAVFHATEGVKRAEVVQVEPPLADLRQVRTISDEAWKRRHLSNALFLRCRHKLWSSLRQGVSPA